MSSPILHPEKLLEELTLLWSTLARDRQAAVLRACSVTLLITCEDDEAGLVRSMVGGIMRDHPSRAILLRVRGGAEPEGRVFAECRRTLGNEQICSEGIEIAADAAHIGEVAAAVAALTTRDLPVTLWCRGPRVFSSPVFEPLFPLAERTIVDSCVAGDCAAALTAIRRLRGRVRLADLAWTRITAWRQALADRLEQDGISAAEIEAVSIHFRGPFAEPCAVYLMRWIARAAPAARIDVAQIAGETGLRAIVVRCARGELRIESAPIRSTGRAETDLILEELSIAGRDPVFEELLEQL